jgi:hypothetical protein
MRPAAGTILILAGWVVSSVAASAQMVSPADHPAIAYSDTTPTDPIARLQQQIDDGTVTLEFDRRRGYLSSVLRHLEIPVSSQGFVFSRTSLQVDKIAPWSPRAIYFNDDVYVGWVQQGAVLEFASVDPVLGAVFYTLAQEATDKPRFERETGTCLMCHDSSSITGGVPGFIVRSVYPDRYGYAISARDGSTSDRTPMEERWGGWYVTGTHGSQRHVGNTMARDLTNEVGNVANYIRRTDFTGGGNVTDLSDRFDTSAYLSPHSDLVALMVLAHQVNVHNLITRSQYEARKALHEESTLLKPTAEAGHNPLTVARIERAVEPLVRAMLFVNETPLVEPVAGTSSFAEEFPLKGPRDSAGRSLRDLDLKTRLFRHPLSFLIYSESFDALPPPAKDYVYRRLDEILSGADPSEDFVHLSTADRSAILEILTETRSDFADRAPTAEAGG